MKIILIIFLVFMLLRILLPYVILYFINKKLAKLKDYRGRIDKVRLKIYSGIIKTENIILNKIDETNHEIAFFKASSIEFTFQWITLFHKSIIGQIAIEESSVEITKEKSSNKDGVPSSSNLKTVFRKIIPFKIDLQIQNGRINYKDYSSKAIVDVTLTNLQLSAASISNTEDKSDPLPAKIKSSADIYEGTLSVNMNLNPFADHLTFDLNTEVKDINLILLNNFLRAYARIDVNKGIFGMYTEVAANNGTFKGYIKPVFKDLDLIGPEDRHDNIFKKLWEGFVAVAVQVLKNKRTDQVATKISIEGKLDNPHINILSAVITILRNGFIQALKPSIDDVVNMDSVRDTVVESKKFLKKIFAE